MAEGRSKAEIGQDILRAAQSELYLNFPYLDVALCGLVFQPGDNLTLSLATDGERLLYDANYLSERFMRSGTFVNRAYLHVVFHCILRHLTKKQGKDPALWDLACDIAVESMLDGLDYPCLGSAGSPLRSSLYGDLRGRMPVLSAEGVYRELQRRKLPEYEQAKLQRAFFADDHGLWDPQSWEDKARNERQDRKWQSASERAQTGMETVLAGRAAGGEAVYQQVKVANREQVDYRAFLRRFAVLREVSGVDGDAFDYGFYAYGLRLYGNLPLIEPCETREEKRIEEFVIAIDTSMSTSGDLVRQFLSATYGILRSTETFSTRVNIRVMQCDDQLRDDTALRDLKELKAYMEDFHLMGGSATDFRPVFQRVEDLQKAGELTALRGLIYFTDGMGRYPNKRPPYETAFVMMEDPVLTVDVPPWAIRLTLTEPELETAARQAETTLERDELELAELPEL